MRYLCVLGFAALLLALVGCSGNPRSSASVDAGTGSVRFTVLWPKVSGTRYIPPETVKIVVTAKQNNVEVGKVEVVRAPGATMATGCIQSVRPMKTALYAEAYDAKDRCIAHGTTSVVVQSGNSVAATLKLVTKLRYVYDYQWGSRAVLDTPEGIGFDSRGHVFVAEVSKGQVREFTKSGTLVNTFGSLGSGVGQLFSPMGLAIDANDRIYVADTANSRIQIFSTSGQVIAIWNEPEDLCEWHGIAIDDAQQIYVSDLYGGLYILDLAGKIQTSA